MIRKAFALFLALATTGIALTACQNDADVASYNVSQAADNFEINRRITVINGITDKFLLVIEGLCSLGNNDPARQLSITCKVGPGQYKKAFVGLGDNVTYLTEQLEPASVGVYHYRIVWKPQGILPDFDFKGSTKELLTNPAGE
ncbi:MAG: hypothetical protein EOR11_20085 [Mesorhizobium sp.]|uniref:beta-sandwich lipoprotein n=1 Tax=Mesorhizobium sp. TaxID=1871066 RepID=UPI000FE86D3D|nr:hypothetical protein [Mesorhizobium sp.]RWP84762.1 MAG: hypothetical protein EOR11_20085 [Mesorhizobium sp.]